jgi:hypothetical protein
MGDEPDTARSWPRTKLTVRHLEAITEHEMVAHFLRTEIHSVRFEETLLALLRRDGTDRRVIDKPDLGNEDENACRTRLLGEWIGREAGERLREAAASGQPLPSRELEFALVAAAHQRRIASHGEWTSPEWREAQQAQLTG